MTKILPQILHNFYKDTSDIGKYFINSIHSTLKLFGSTQLDETAERIHRLVTKDSGVLFILAQGFSFYSMPTVYMGSVAIGCISSLGYRLGLLNHNFIIIKSQEAKLDIALGILFSQCLLQPLPACIFSGVVLGNYLGNLCNDSENTED